MFGHVWTRVKLVFGHKKGDVKRNDLNIVR